LAQAQQLRKPQKYFPKNEGSKKRSSYPTRKNRGSYPDRTDKGHPSKREPVIMEPPPASTDSSGQTPDFVAPAASTLVLELNTADSLDLQQLAGIGPAFSRRIVKYRQLLGGYARVDQLLEVYGMDSARYLLIAGHLTVDTTKVQRMDLRTATLKELMRHPYIEFYVAKLLVSCREPSDTTRSYSELEEISGIPPALLNRIRPYLSFQ
jgi:DNA uptake protein ComE-like DNA-binding protein